MCGIFAYLNYLEPKTRAEILEILLNGLKRLEYRGYDSAGRLNVIIMAVIVCIKRFFFYNNHVECQWNLHLFKVLQCC